MLALAALACAAGALAARNRSADPANINGAWSYRTRSNCGPVDGVGQVTFAWDPAARAYDEQGHVFWSHTGDTIRWWGRLTYDPQSRRLVGRHSNTLGDQVDVVWQMEGQGPERLVVRWNQTNGCVGTGIATRPGG